MTPYRTESVHFFVHMNSAANIEHKKVSYYG